MSQDYYEDYKVCIGAIAFKFKLVHVVVVFVYINEHLVEL